MVEKNLKNNAPPNIGKTLKEARLAQKLSIDEISKKLCIGKSHLKKLEEDHQNLICDVYTLGFLRSYANFLGLEAQELSQQLKENSHQPSIPLPPFPAPTPGKGIPSFPILGFSILSLIGLFIGIKWYILPQASSPISEPQELVEDLPPPSSTTTLQSETLPSSPASSDNILSEALPPQDSLNDESSLENQLTSPSLSNNIQSEASSPSTLPSENVLAETLSPPTPSDRLSSEVLPETLPVAEETPPVKKEEMGPTLSSSSLPVILRFTEDTWIQVKDSEGNVLVNRIFRPEESYELKSTHGLTLKTGNALGMQLVSGNKVLRFADHADRVQTNVPLDPKKWVDLNHKTQ